MSNHEARAAIALGFDHDIQVEAAAKAGWDAYCRCVYGRTYPESEKAWGERARVWRWVAMAILDQSEQPVSNPDELGDIDTIGSHAGNGGRFDPLDGKGED